MSDGSIKPPAINPLDPSSLSSQAPKQTNKEIGKNEFLQLLVTQLKHQDPLDPMQNDEFAVNLAQFSQLEQLVSMNEKMDLQQGSSNDFSSMAAYLGHEVTLASNKVNVDNGDAGLLKFNLSQDVSELAIELLGADGSVKETISLGAMGKGNQTASLSEVSSENGAYGFRIKATGTDGSSFEPVGRVAGIVDGFVPGPEPMLIIGGRQVNPADILEVNVQKSA
jgi:flagellar basal-body rod modification protein FlgD